MLLSIGVLEPLHQNPDGLEVGIGKLLEFAKQGDVLLVLVGRVRVLADQIGDADLKMSGLSVVR